MSFHLFWDYVNFYQNKENEKKILLWNKKIMLFYVFILIFNSKQITLWVIFLA